MRFQSNPQNHSDVVLGKIKNSFFKNEKLTEAELNHHVHIVGASGYGKSVLLSHIIRSRINEGKGLLYIDLKGDMETISAYREAAILAGRDKDLEVFSLTPGSSEAAYNLVGDGTATQIRDRIMRSFNWSEEYYKNLTSSFLLKLLIVLCEVRTHARGFSLRTILDILRDREILFQLTAKLNPAEKETKALAQEIYNFLGEREGNTGLQGLKTQIESLVLSDFGDKICGEGIDLFKIINSQKLCFVFLDTRRYGESATAVGKLILQDLKSTSSRIDSEIPQAERRPFTVIIDEFADLAQEDFIGFLDRARSSRMSVVVAHQELSDLRRISPEFAARLTGNTSTLYAFLQKNAESAEMISSTAGTRTVWKSTRQTERFGFFEIDSGKGSKREVEEFNIHPNVIKALGVGRCVCIKKFPRARSYVVNVARE
jgi:type IV secretory pathway TraG/TraD family ATPase VirD4